MGNWFSRNKRKESQSASKAKAAMAEAEAAAAAQASETAAASNVSETAAAAAPETRPASPAPKTRRPATGTPRGEILLSSSNSSSWQDLNKNYVLGTELGRGQFGVTKVCTRRSDGRKLACKTIAKRKLRTKSDIQLVHLEVQIMHHLCGHAHIVQLLDTCEDRNGLHLIMELCEGGELFDRIVQKGNYSERAAAGLCRTIVRVVQACHSLGVMHRDLKPENFLFATKAEDSALKTTDFGLSVFFKPGEKFTEVAGSAFYVAPEVLRRSYGPEADVWSAGIILYILLSGVPPFWAETDQGIFDAILRGNLDLSCDPWPTISNGAKDLLRKMLIQDPKERISSQDVLNHPWVREDGEAPDKPLDNAVLSRMKQFSAMNKLKKLALKVIAENLSEQEIMGLKAMFKTMDTDNNGTITLDELKVGLAKLGSNLAESEVQQLMQAADVDRNGSIDYLEFITATMHLNKAEKEDHLYAAFQYFDKDNSGYITVEELEQALGDQKMEDLKEIIQEVDTDKDGRIDYDEFVAMMRKGSLN